MEQFCQMDLIDVKKKLNNRRSIIEFFMEIGYYYPPFSCYNYQYCLQVLSGQKKVNHFFHIKFFLVALKTWPNRRLFSAIFFER